MYRYILKRLLMLLPVLLGVLLIIFILSEITPGDAARQLAGEFASEEDVQAIREELGLNRPFLERFFSYLTGLVTRGDLGVSYQTGQPVIQEIADRFPTTLLLALVSMLFSILIGIPTGIISAIRQYSWIDSTSMVVALVGVSMPNFWQGLLNIIVFSIWLGWLPASGFYGWQYWILPAVTIGTSSAAMITRMTRSSMLEVIHQDYIRTARAKGQKENVIIIKHALKNALIPIVTVVGIQFGGLLGGAVLTETVFAIPGLGKFMVDAIKARNYPVVQGGVLVLAVVFSVVNLLVDILYSYIDPRLKSMYRKTVRIKN
ncbi:MAG TPA: ABC transporter permease [Candidatus Pullichristensenella excrementigallinarum]|uniref:Nickel import system permease protein NikB n=1 Tax=Candidatus Pullichristensenella excrementigallinarum TaxID=2840907 RepID=A0A9D1IC46_9FIRM|nr:ABC transporter permease [Candidatus Pullichristensenella excrementigallinarum]